MSSVYLVDKNVEHLDSTESCSAYILGLYESTTSLFTGVNFSNIDMLLIFQLTSVQRVTCLLTVLTEDVNAVMDMSETVWTAIQKVNFLSATDNL